MSRTTAGQGRTALVTGCAGFIGSHLTERLLRDGWAVRGVDAFTDFYPRARKERNLVQARVDPRVSFYELDLSSESLGDLLDGVDTVFHLAAQAGVRGSFGRTFDEYVRHNIVATQRVLDALVGRPGPSFVYASSSSVYGNALQLPTSEHTDRHPVSPYGMTKVATEELAGVYSRTYGVPTVGLRYFTAYGPRQRPDMAFSRFVTAALLDEEILVNGDGLQERDFTYVDDVVDATVAAAAHAEPLARVYNIGGTHAVSINEVLDLVSRITGKRLRIRHVASQPGDAVRTSADITAARRFLGYSPAHPLEEGLHEQVRWTEAELNAPAVEIALPLKAAPPLVIAPASEAVPHHAPAAATLPAAARLLPGMGMVNAPPVT